MTEVLWELAAMLRFKGQQLLIGCQASCFVDGLRPEQFFLGCSKQAFG